MKLDNFEIRFDNSRGVFTAGQSVSGHVVLKLTKAMKMKTILLYFEGRAKSHWEVKQGRSKTDYRATENYINHTVVLFGSENEVKEHPAGLHTYPFNLPISASIPSSFEGRRGYVRYFCRATIKRPWKFDEHVKRAFTVIHHLDLNFEATAGMPLWGEAEETIDGCCCTSGNVHARITINKTGYVPGEPLNYTIDINNRSDNLVTGLDLELRQVVKYTGYSDSIFSSGNPKYHSKTDTFPLFSGFFQVKRHSDGHLSQQVCIPALPPSRLDGCGIIDISYFVIMQPIVRWSSFNITREIIIGTIPLQHAMAAPPPSFNEVAGGDAGLVAPSAPSIDLAPPPYQEPPPSYEESVLFGRVEIRDENDDDHTEGSGNWAPAYPYYHWDPSTQHFEMVATAQGSALDSAFLNQATPAATNEDIALDNLNPHAPPSYNQL